MNGFIERLRSLRVAREEEETDRIRKWQEYEKERRQEEQREQDKRLAELKEVFEGREFLKQHVLPIIETVNLECLAGGGKIRYAEAPEVPESWEEWLKKYGVRNTHGRFEELSVDTNRISLEWDRDSHGGQRQGLEIYFYRPREASGNVFVVVGGGEQELYGGSWRPEELNPQEEGCLDKLEARILEILEDPQKSMFPSPSRDEGTMSFNYGG